MTTLYHRVIFHLMLRARSGDFFFGTTRTGSSRFSGMSAVRSSKSGYPFLKWPFKWVFYWMKFRVEAWKSLHDLGCSSRGFVSDNFYDCIIGLLRRDDWLDFGGTRFKNTGLSTMRCSFRDSLVKVWLCCVLRAWGCWSEANCTI